MAKKSVTESTFAKNPRGVYSVGQKSSLPANVGKMLDGPTVTRSQKGDIKQPPAMGKRIGAVANKYGKPIGPSNKGTVPGGRGIMALNNVRLKPTAGAPKATVRAGQPVSAAGTPKRSVGGVIRTTVNERLSSSRKTGTAMAKNRVTGTTTGFTSGTTTGKTVSKPGVAGKTSMSPTQRMAQNAFNKGGVAGPSRNSGGGGASKTSGGARSSGGGRGMTGPTGMGQSGRGTGSKR